MKAVFSRLFRDELMREEARYHEISERWAGAFHERIAGQTREIIRWGGGDHVGPQRKEWPSPERAKLNTGWKARGFALSGLERIGMPATQGFALGY